MTCERRSRIVLTRSKNATGLSNVTPKQVAEGQSITEIVCVQDFYDVAHISKIKAARAPTIDDGFIDELAAQGIACEPFFPLGGFTRLQSSVPDAAAASLQVTPMRPA
jgi:pyridoxine 4-dehydrogenase